MHADCRIRCSTPIRAAASQWERIVASGDETAAVGGRTERPSLDNPAPRIRREFGIAHTLGASGHGDATTEGVVIPDL